MDGNVYGFQECAFILSNNEGRRAFLAYLELRAFVSVYIDDRNNAMEGEGLSEEELLALYGKQPNEVMDIVDAN